MMGRRLRRAGAIPARWAWFRRAAVTLARYRERDGDHYAAAVTFFTLLSLVPLLMIVVSVAGFVLAGDELLVAELDKMLAQALPSLVSDQVGGILRMVIEERGRLGVVALVVSLYSGWSWISNLRDAVTALLGEPRPPKPLLRTVFADVVTLVGIGVALAVSFTLAALTGFAGGWLLDRTGLSGTFWAHLVLVAGSLLLGLTTNWLVIAWCLAKLPRNRRPVTSGLRAAAVAAVGLAALQQAGGLYVLLLGRSPAVTILGAIVGLLLLVYLIVRWLLLVTVWTTTGSSGDDTASGLGQAGATLAVGASAGLAIRTLSGH
ncbi:YihY/virulence factor BrkB family protein [Amycolatopsis acidicola]|uniref:YihY/virulence factor BrkB family protein n=1 Tax=Amycolatopsis acidicola TaxID=2596893 RepID=A0A5N0UZB1_9PSEU|nr:YihY/virulence factor BrkB family protein [Amycolatopsis acidicola]KAA9155394.1 YihY/virulence factor BrkB family protein [Amycolatopsis acidicola]